MNSLKIITKGLKQVYGFLTHRILWLLIVTVVLFLLLFMRLFTLQIVETDRFVFTPPENVFIEIPLQPLRGTIYDRHGRPLAVNNLAFVVKMDPSVQITNEALLALTDLFERNDERFVDNFPIALPEVTGDGFQFTFTGNAPRQAYRWMADLAVPNPNETTAEEAFLHLRTFFRIDPELSDEDARRILNFRCQIFMLRLIDFTHYNPVPILFAADVSHATMAEISERNQFFAGVFIDIQTQRYYPGGRYVSHIIGYVRQITAGQYEANRHRGYTQQCLFGRSGLENSLEIEHLRGTPGVQRIEVNRAGRRVGEPEILIEPIPGDRVFLSIDLELQRAAYYMLKDYLTRALIGRLTLAPRTGEAVAQNISMPDAFASLVSTGNLNLRRVLEAEADNPAFAMRLYITERDRSPSLHGEGLERIHRIIIEGLESGRISPAMMLLTLIGTGQINDPNGEKEQQLTTRPRDALPVLVQSLENWELTPQMFNLDPSTGSIVVVDVHTGGILAAASYPAFDNNRLVNILDEEYFARLNTNPARPMIYRALMESIAPGSTIKMIPAIAALEIGTIGVNTPIFSTGRFQPQGAQRHLIECWARHGHGRLNVAEAIAVSCNVFFADAVFRMGNNFGHTNTALEGLDMLNQYMTFFGLHESSGVELWEHYNFERHGRGYSGSLLPSLEFSHHRRGTEISWLDADTSQAAIGQGLASFTPVQMARAMLGLANRSSPYPLHFVRQVESRDGTTPVDRRNAPEMPEPDLYINEATWNAVANGMRLATEGSSGGHRGTAVGVFSGSPVQIAGKTGTAQERRDRFDHLSFGAFAPLNDPQIAVYVSVPFSSMNRLTTLTQMPARISRDIIELVLANPPEPQRPTAFNTVRP